MTNVRTNTERLRQISERLPLGARSEIARRAGVTPAAITQTLNGKRNSPRLTEAIFSYYLEWATQEAARQASVDRALKAIAPATK